MVCHLLRHKAYSEYLDMAFRYALCGRPGPVFLELPPDILNVAVEDFEFHPTTDILRLLLIQRIL
jgi:thiamine pyrophosphate-dependent acetolactate synthase large subunit-like protein